MAPHPYGPAGDWDNDPDDGYEALLKRSDEGHWLWASLQSAIAALEAVGQPSPELSDQLQDLRNCLDHTARSFGNTEGRDGEV